MKRFLSLIIAIIFLLFCLPLTACSGDDIIYLNVYNCEEYIAEGDEFDMVQEFEKWYKKTYHQTVKVNYSTYGTNENMYNELKLTKNKKKGTYNYDLVCPSDYMLQNMLKEGMLEKFDTVEENGEIKYTEELDQYETYCSPYIKDLFKTNGWYEYAVCYMWGTMGYVYNPENEKVSHEDMKSWSGIFNPAYKYKSTIKDSPRDSYILAQGIACKDELLELKDSYKSGEIDAKAYNSKVIEIFNRADADSIAKAGDALNKVKDVVYGFEVDSGKGDIATGKLLINFAWSGDAVYALDIAEEETGTELYYSVPEEGSNVWFDGWVMPKGANKVVAQRFLNFISTPANTIENMNYIGYTPSIAGDEMFENAIDWYGFNVLVEADATDEEATEINGKFYKEVYFGDIDDLDSIGAVEFDEDGYQGYKCAKLLRAVYDDDEEKIIDFEELENVTVYANDISYFFGEGSIIYTDVVNRQFTTQYPSEEIVNRCAIMLYFNKAENARLNEMWSSFKVGYMSPALMIAIVIAVIVITAAAVVAIKLIRSGKFGYGKERKNLTLVSRKEIKK